MLYKLEYVSKEERVLLLEKNKDKYLIEEQNIAEGNFLIFTDVKPNQLILEDLQKDAQTTKSKLNALNEKASLVEGAIFELATIVLE